MSVLGFIDFSHPFELERDASLKGLGGMLSQKDEHGKSRALAYCSWSLHSRKQLMTIVAQQTLYYLY